MARKKILIVEDEATLVEMLKVRLVKAGYEVFAAYDGESGLKMAYDFQPDLIILDIQIPKKGGLEFYKEISPHGRSRFPVLILTARGELSDLFRQIEADGFMRKPFEAHDLLREIDRILEKSNQIDAFVIDSKEDPGSAEIITALAGERYKAILIENLTQFKELGPVHRPRFVAMEYLQPSMSGENLIQGLRRILSEFPEEVWPSAREVSIIVSSYSGMNYSSKSLKAGADKYIGKPADYGEIVTALRELEIKKRQSNPSRPRLSQGRLD